MVAIKAPSAQAPVIEVCTPQESSVGCPWTLGHARKSAFGRFRMTKADLARIIYTRYARMTSREASRVIDLLFDLIKERLMKGESVRIVGFGKLEVVRRKPRRGRNPVTGEPIEVAGRRTLVFRPSRSIRSV
jgi:nucleoid DNA-binding protein